MITLRFPPSPPPRAYPILSCQPTVGFQSNSAYFPACYMTLARDHSFAGLTSSQTLRPHFFFTCKRDSTYDMGWLRAVHGETTELKSNQNRLSVEVKGNQELDKESTSSTKRVPISASPHPQELQPLPFVYRDTPNSELPFLSAAQVALTC